LRWTSEASPDPFAGSQPHRFGRPQKRPRGPRLPVILVTGFLGAGKTTLIRRLLERPEGRNSVVIVNEFGEIGIDQALIATASEATVLIGNGCACCAVRSDLEQALRNLLIDRANGTIPSFERAIIETSGAADPVPILQTFISDRALGREYHLDAVVTVVDAVHGERTLAEAPESERQIAVADRIVISKADLCGAEAKSNLTSAIRRLNPGAPIATANSGEIAPGFLLEERAAALLPLPTEGRVEAIHSPGLNTFTLHFDAPIRWAALSRAIEVLIELRGPDILRIKGLVAVEGCRGPLVVQVVRHVAHPPVELVAWPDADRHSRLVFITRGLARDEVRALFDAIAALAPKEA
jgi:G3E family GTPase